LKKERNERAKAIEIEAEKELASVRQQVVDFQQERRRECSARRAQKLSRVRDLVEQRKTIELKMLEVVTGVHSAMQEVEEMIVAGFEGRSGDARQSLEALRVMPHQVIRRGAPLAHMTEPTMADDDERERIEAQSLDAQE
ncbi:hypothetical protein E4U53_007972, partial [Claviceps sorghi]